MKITYNILKDKPCLHYLCHISIAPIACRQLGLYVLFLNNFDFTTSSCTNYPSVTKN